jgi:hypothetical protein
MSHSISSFNATPIPIHAFVVDVEFRGSGDKGLSDPLDSKIRVPLSTLLHTNATTTPNRQLLPGHVSWDRFKDVMQKELKVTMDPRYTEVGYKTVAPTPDVPDAYFVIKNEATFQNAISVLCNAFTQQQPRRTTGGPRFTLFLFNPIPKTPLFRRSARARVHQSDATQNSFEQQSPHAEPSHPNLSSRSTSIPIRHTPQPFQHTPRQPSPSSQLLLQSSSEDSDPPRARRSRKQHHIEDHSLLPSSSSNSDGRPSRSRSSSPIEDGLHSSNFDAAELLKKTALEELEPPSPDDFESEEEWQIAMAEWREQQNLRERAA